MRERLRRVRDTLLVTRTGKKIADGSDYLVTGIHYVVSGLEQWFVGSSLGIILNPLSTNSVFQNENFSSSVTPASVKYITPSSEKELAQLLKELDKQVTARVGYQSLSLMTGDEIFLAQSSTQALHKRKILISYFKPREFAATAREILWQPELIEAIGDELLLCRRIVLHMIAKSVFGMEKIPDKLATVLAVMSKRFEMSLQNYQLVDQESAKQIKAAFQLATNEFFEQQMPNIISALQSGKDDVVRHNLVADVVRELMIKAGLDPTEYQFTEDDVAKYFTDPSVLSLPWVFMAADNISGVIHGAFHEVVSEQSDLVLLIALEYALEGVLRNEPRYYRSMNLQDMVWAAQRDLANSLNDGYTLFSAMLSLQLQANQSSAAVRLRELLPDLRINTHDEINGVLAYLRTAIENYNIYGGLFDQSGRLDVNMLRSDVNLNQLYDNMLRANTRNLNIIRFAKHQVQVGDIAIPANCTVVFKLGEQVAVNSEVPAAPLNQHLLFSAGERKCPGSMVAEYIFKSVVAEMVRGVQIAAKDLSKQRRVDVSYRH